MVLISRPTFLRREAVVMPPAQVLWSPGKRPALRLVGVNASHIPKDPVKKKKKKILIHFWARALLPKEVFSKEDGARGI